MKSSFKILFFVFFVVCLTACGPRLLPSLRIPAEKTLADFPGPTLRPVSKSDPVCPDISGNYRSPHVPFLYDFPRADNQNGIRVREENLRDKPIRRGSGPNGDFYRDDTSEFQRGAIWGVEQRDKTLTITLMDGSWTPYKRLTYGLDHPMIGCHAGSLYIRATVFNGGGKAWSTERRLRKLPRGDLEIQPQYWEWYYDYYEGLLGYDPVTDKPGGSVPKKREWTTVFPAVQQMPPSRGGQNESPKTALPQ
jgi:hypothetical protein